AEIGVFLSHEGQETLAPKFVNLGKPIVMTTLDNQLKVPLVALSQPFDPSILPKSEILAKSKNLLLQSEPVVEQKNLNALLFTAPKDGEALQVLDVGGVALRRVPLSNRGDV